jgi:urease accessory protein UreH
LNQIIADQRGISLDELALKSGDKKPETTQPVDDPSKTTSASVNVEPAVESPVEQLTPEQQAKKYRSEADRLAKEAANFRRMAEELVPIVKKPRKQKTAV